jgi:hypothetical protein
MASGGVWGAAGRVFCGSADGGALTSAAGARRTPSGPEAHLPQATRGRSAACHDVRIIINTARVAVDARGRPQPPLNSCMRACV